MSRARPAQPTVLVTGATGFLGRHLVEQLFGREDPATLRLLTSAPAAPSPPSGGGEAEAHAGWSRVSWVHGSLTEPATARAAVAGVRRIYHLAGRVSRRAEDAAAMHAVHVEGTRLLCSAARDAGVEKLVLASTSGTLAVSTDAGSRPSEQTTPPLALIARWPYYASKLYQERAAEALCAEGGPALCILHPSLLLGPGDARLSSTGDVLRFLQRDLPLVPSGGLNFVDVRDAAAAFLAAMDHRGDDARGVEHYLLGGPNWSFAEFFGRLERLSKVAAPRLRLPAGLALWGARALEACYRQLDQAAPIEAASVEMAQHFWYLDDSKARRELGFVSRDPAETLADTVRDLRQRFRC
ncbi:MAG: NAD-dependent epimerase/dehydratase family protein [Proteobacteria bacterium]|nr:NAD-dependent epimerase/dehydratase family protein [Pseudomonadota bacterium]